MTESKGMLELKLLKKEYKNYYTLGEKDKALDTKNRILNLSNIIGYPQRAILELEEWTREYDKKRFLKAYDKLSKKRIKKT